jgi:hypothetical protein
MVAPDDERSCSTGVDEKLVRRRAMAARRSQNAQRRQIKWNVWTNGDRVISHHGRGHH